MAFDFACHDWADRLQRGDTPIADLPLNAEEAARAVAIFNKLRLPDVIGQPELRDAAGDWMRDIVRAIFGSMQTSGLGPEVRQVGEVFILVPKKNAKTTSAAESYEIYTNTGDGDGAASGPRGMRKVVVVPRTAASKSARPASPHGSSGGVAPSCGGGAGPIRWRS